MPLSQRQRHFILFPICAPQLSSGANHWRGMRYPSGGVHSFIIRIWREAREIPDAPVEWRGSIEHVGTEHRSYFKSLREIIPFILPYLKQLGAPLPWTFRVREWARGQWLRAGTKSKPNE